MSTRHAQWALPLLFLSACQNDFEVTPYRRILTTAPLVDAGLVAAGDRLTVSIQLRSEGSGPVTVTDIQLENEGDEEAFVLLDWADEDGYLEIPGGSPEVPGTALVQVNFRPEQPGYFRALMTITSNDNVSEDGIWKVALRGMAQEPCGSIAPAYLDFGAHVAGGYFGREVQVFNCGMVTLTVAAFKVDGSASFAVYTPDPVYVVPGGSESVEIGWTPSFDPDAGIPETATITLVTNDADLDAAVTAVGNDCSQSADPSWDGDNDGWFSCGGDCDDTDRDVNPASPERAGNGVDDDCDGTVDETDDDQLSADDDGDGYSENDGDCDDANEEVHPGATELANSVDDDCDGTVDEDTERVDDDLDGFSEREGDCDDGDPYAYPGARETIDGVDNDCDGTVDEGGVDSDDDGDGYSENDGDCDDNDPWAWPGAPEDCDEVDNDCDGTVDEDDACAYLVVHEVDTGITQHGGSGCSSLPARGAPGAALLLLGLGLAARRREVKG